MVSGAQPAPGNAYRVLRELGSRAQRTFAALRDPHELVVLHRFVRSDLASTSEATAVSSESLALLLRDAQSIAKNWHQNVARVKHIDLAHGDLSIATELVEGSTLTDLFAAAASRGASFPLDVLVRIVLDVLAGIHSLHGLRDGRNQPLGAIHGELCPTNIVVGRDGIARVVNVLRPRPARIKKGSEALGQAAPESLDDSATDARADVYAVGVILWEALSGKKLHDEKEPARVLARLREIEIARPPKPADASFAPLVDVAMRALSFEPALRFRTAAEMATEIRKVPRIASGSVVAARVSELDGDRIRRRRAVLERTPSGTRPRPSPATIEAAKVAAPEPPRIASHVERKSATKPAPPLHEEPIAVDPSAVDMILVEEPPANEPQVTAASKAPPAPQPSPSSEPVVAGVPFTTPPSSILLPDKPATTSALNAAVDVEIDGDVASSRKQKKRGLVLAAAAGLLLLALVLVFGRSRPSDEVTARTVEPPAPKEAVSIAATTAAPPSSATSLAVVATADPTTPPDVASPEPSPSGAASLGETTATTPPATTAGAAPSPPSDVRRTSSPRRYEPLGI